MFFQRVFAAIVRSLSRIFHCFEMESVPGFNGAARTVEYFTDSLGPRYCLIREGRIHRVSGLCEVLCDYNEDGTLLRCYLGVFEQEEDDELVIGKENILDRQVQLLEESPYLSSPTYFG